MSISSRIEGLESKGNPSFKELTELLKDMELEHVRAPKVVVKYGRLLIESHRSQLGDKVWDLYERLFFAAMDLNLNEVRDMCLQALKKRFPDSTRVMILEGMRSEAHGEYSVAQRVYEEVLQKDSVNIPAFKRLVALQKATGNTSAAIEQLNKYLLVFSSDQQAWQELSELYLSLGKHDLAKFCMEEILLIQPDNHLHHLQYAELLYTIGSSSTKDKESLQHARQYFAQSLELKPDNNLRALYGLSMCLRAKGSSTKAIHSELQRW
eukprot:CAMPEP_0175148716 /NCGR_PEP_ID=MMETSP0087-20121206/16795_1 /TAXON_ID=136419 /ORGANISM="Unknown Unknown, Strain D1" /LENGTH=265 /DNA_ID=CAMNT_0016434233 /DNA_START=36 /DNA_END=830 /DNA_ORIENTATION=-